MSQAGRPGANPCDSVACGRLKSGLPSFSESGSFATSPFCSAKLFEIPGDLLGRLPRAQLRTSCGASPSGPALWRSVSQALGHCVWPPLQLLYCTQVPQKGRWCQLWTSTGHPFSWDHQHKLLAALGLSSVFKSMFCVVFFLRLRHLFWGEECELSESPASAKSGCLGVICGSLREMFCIILT